MDKTEFPFPYKCPVCGCPEFLTEFDKDKLEDGIITYRGVCSMASCDYVTPDFTFVLVEF